ncbi:Nucleic acid-binding [Vigna unguiculata]|uniref:Nucleic acid-binding n=1 Tax=Vigna unguiculata TaxID=3917 RepID=A0A4D6NI67_VIGUN|nr:Nucleic acid-binding [Vigna unguiculata]
MVLLKDIVPAAQNNIESKFIVLEKGSTTLEGKNRICLTLVADETAAVHLQLWGDECDAFDSGDIIRLTKGIFSYQHGNLILRAGKRGKLEKTGEFVMSYVEVNLICSKEQFLVFSISASIKVTKVFSHIN